MAKFNLLVIFMVLLACSTIPARISSQSMDATTMIKSEDGMEMRAAASGGLGAVLRSYNGCSQNRKPHESDALFCCNKDKECWASLQECMANCPCKVNC